MGWLPNRNNTDDIGALALGEYRDGELTFIGRVGSGLGSQVRRELEPKLLDLRQGAVLEEKQTRAHWVEPQLVVLEFVDPVPHQPMLAKSGEASDRKDWIYELKYDGYRLIVEKQDRVVRLWSRNGHDLTTSFPEIAQAIYHLPITQCVIDGEIVVHDERGVPSFSLLQQRARLSDELQVAVALEFVDPVFAIARQIR